MSGHFLDRPCHLLNLQYVHSCTSFCSKRCINLFNHSPLDEYSGSFQIWATTNTTAMKYPSKYTLCIHTVTFRDYIPKSGLLGQREF